MAKISTTRTNDYYRFVVTFADKTKLSANYGSMRSVKIEPLTDIGLLRRLGDVLDPIFFECLGLASKYTFDEYFATVEAAANEATDVESFIVRFKTEAASRLRHSFEEKERPRRDLTTTVTTKEGRGRWKLVVSFSNGDDFVLDLTGSSVGAGMTPKRIGLENLISDLAFSFMRIRKLKDAEAMAKIFAAAAEGCRSVEDWIVELQSELEGRPKAVTVAKADDALVTRARKVLEAAAAGLDKVIPGPWAALGGYLTTRTENQHARTAFDLSEMGSSRNLQDPRQSVKFARREDVEHIALFDPDSVRIIADAFAALVEERDALRAAASAVQGASA